MEKEFFYFGALLLSASALALFSNRLKQSTIAGYLLAGALARFFLQPSVTFEFLSSLGAILLLFFVGLEFSMNKVRSLGKKVFLLSLLDLLINFPLGLLCGYLFGWNPLEIFFLGGIVYVSSSAVISKLLVDAGCMPRHETRTVLGILIVEDIVMAVMLAIFAALAHNNSSVDLALISIALLKALLFCGFFVVLEKPIRSFLNFLLNVEQEEIFLLEIIGLIFIIALFSKFIGLSEATGAFFIGSALAESEHKGRIKKLLGPLGFFAAALFFLSFGLQVDLLAIDRNVIAMVLTLILVSIGGKLLTGLAAVPIQKISLAEAQNVGYSLFSRGEFSILIASLLATQGMAVHGIKEITAVYVFVLMILSSVLIKRYTNTCAL
ncbi:MAG: cation:proton antiporter [Candidatus Margulisbacteria bacterium]|nr:cation:proton antiporter [Candidatus Margulisiibacteriota bacterium]MBU1616630.1 cation:proton antiporter [Candidatus Margulisiibacteriota bacterium]